MNSRDPVCSSPRTDRGHPCTTGDLTLRTPFSTAGDRPCCLLLCCLRLQFPLINSGVLMKDYAPRQREEKQNRNYVVLFSLHQGQYFTASLKQHSLLHKQLCESPSSGPPCSPLGLTLVCAVCPSALFLRPTFHLLHLSKSEIMLELWLQSL